MRSRVHVIAPYATMVPVVSECCALFPELIIRTSVGSLEDGVNIAIKEECTTDIFISRGTTAKLIKNAVKKPVIDMHISGYDLIRSLSLASNLTTKSALIGMQSITHVAKAIIGLMDIPISIYTVEHLEEIPPLILELKNKGFKQIIGDRLVTHISETYGLKGFLIQSSKETILQALERAKQINEYKNYADVPSKIFEQIVQSKYKNIVVLSKENHIIYEHFSTLNFTRDLKDHLYILNTDMNDTKPRASKLLVVDNDVIEIKGYYVSEFGYKLFVLKKYNHLINQHGLTVQTHSLHKPVIKESSSIQHVYKQVELLFKHKEPILLVGEQGTGKDFISTYIHEKHEDGLLLTIDFKYFDINQLNTLPIQYVRTIKLKHCELIEEVEVLSAFIQNCLEKHIHMFVLCEHNYQFESFEWLKCNKIQLPTLQERKEDIVPLIHYFLSKFHEEYGTTPVKIKNKSLTLLEETNYPFNIDDLHSIMKQIVLNEKDYIIQHETVERILKQQSHCLKPISLKGTLKEIEREIIELVLKEENFNQSKTAERLGINRATLWRKLKNEGN
ncbi:PrpR N-terminal domain-containing protein [Ureibacillus sp. FSL E2-3493]|uniref:PrpR N-terminal domain-containing protein n=1 Tax=Ureibacillus sp. FSL E2-3493 TaxID=2921367 RepID=UPI00311A8136